MLKLVNNNNNNNSNNNNNNNNKNNNNNNNKSNNRSKLITTSYKQTNGEENDSSDEVTDHEDFETEANASEEVNKSANNNNSIEYRLSLLVKAAERIVSEENTAAEITASPMQLQPRANNTSFKANNSSVFSDFSDGEMDNRRATSYSMLVDNKSVNAYEKEPMMSNDSDINSHGSHEQRINSRSLSSSENLGAVNDKQSKEHFFERLRMGFSLL